MKDHVSRKDFREMEVGETRRFRLPGPAKVQAARVAAGQMREEGMKFECTSPMSMKMRGEIDITRTE